CVRLVGLPRQQHLSGSFKPNTFHSRRNGEPRKAPLVSHLPRKRERKRDQEATKPGRRGASECDLLPFLRVERNGPVEHEIRGLRGEGPRPPFSGDERNAPRVERDAPVEHGRLAHQHDHGDHGQAPVLDLLQLVLLELGRGLGGELQRVEPVISGLLAVVEHGGLDHLA
ncbi:unnamed protein product, partial [Ectocarpus sp. 4 AP-2014]